MTQETTLRRAERDLGELLEEHRGGVDLSEIEGTPVVPFARERLGFDPWEPCQREVLEALEGRPQVLVQGGNAVGKDAAAAVAALWWTFTKGGLVLVTAAVERQLVDVFMGEVRRLWRRAGDLPGQLYRSALRVPGSEHAGIVTFTSTEASKLTGYHAPRVLAILSEAQAVEDFGWEGLMANATGSEDRILAVGNPLSPGTRFYHASRSKRWHTIRIPASEHPNVREGRTVIPGGPSPAFVERIAREWGRDSGQFVARVEARFPEESEEHLLRRSWLEEATRKHREADLDYWSEGDVVVGVDPARFGPDATAVAIRRGMVVHELRIWRGEDATTDTVDRLRKLLDELTGPESPRVGAVVIDEIGVGGGVVDGLEVALRGRKYRHAPVSRGRRRPPTRESGVEVVGFNSSRSAKDTERFLNLRAAAYWTVRERLEDGELFLPSDEGLVEELAAVRWQVTGSGAVQIEAKADLKARLGRSPDKADAVAMSIGREAMPRGKQFWFR